jgi:TonB family protein
MSTVIRGLRVNRIALSLAAIWLTGCATAYQRHGITGGYTEKKINDSAYIVTFNGNGFADGERVYHFWLFRCAELTLQSGYDLFELRPVRTARISPGSNASMRQAAYQPDQRGRLRPALFVPLVIPMGTVKTWSYRATVLMYRKPLPHDLLMAFDARETIAELGPYVKSNGKAAPPTSEELVARILVAHAHIALGGDIVAEAAARIGSNIATSPDESGSFRSISDVVETLQGGRLPAFHRAYLDYLTGAGQNNSKGIATFELIVSPNGHVINCQVVSTSFTDSQFVAALVEVLRQTEFVPRQVLTTRYSKVQISFEPVEDPL